VSRTIALTNRDVEIRYDGVAAILAVKRPLVVPYEQIRAVEVGTTRPPALAWRVGLSDPIGGWRRGRFWSGGRKLFVDLRRPERAVVLQLDRESDFDAVALEVDRPEELAEAIRARIARTS